jgi:sugar lactone lactonase YvrE
MTLRTPLLLLLAAAFALPACDRLDRKGMVLVVDPAWSASVLLSQKDGIVSPDGLMWEDGRLYIADEGGSAVRAWSPDEGLRTLADAAAGIQSPEDLVRGLDGSLYFTDDDAGGLWRIDAGGNAVQIVRPESGLTATEAIARHPSGAILVGDGAAGRVFSVAADGTARPLPLRISKPESMAFDDQGNLYIADNRDDLLYLLTPDGRLHRPVRSRAGFSPETIHYADGGLYITDSGSGRLYRYTPEDGLTTLALFGGELANVQGVTTDGDGNIYLSVQTDLKGGRGYILRMEKRMAR